MSLTAFDNGLLTLIIIGLVQGLKKMGLNRRYAPPAALIVAIVITGIYYSLFASMRASRFEQLAHGIVLGLLSMGGASSLKYLWITVNGREKPEIRGL